MQIVKFVSSVSHRMGQIVRSHFPHSPLMSFPCFCVRGDGLSSLCAACGGSPYTGWMKWFSKVGSSMLLLQCFTWHVRGFRRYVFCSLGKWEQ
jgi:hypothetical protein